MGDRTADRLPKLAWAYIVLGMGDNYENVSLALSPFLTDNRPLRPVPTGLPYNRPTVIAIGRLSQ